MGDGDGMETLGVTLKGRGDLSATVLVRVFVTEKPKLLRFLRSRLRRMDDPCQSAEDLAQEAFIRFAGAGAPVVNPGALLFRIASNLAHSHEKTERRRAELRQEAHDLLWEGIDRTTPERCALAGEALRQVIAAVGTLPPRSRQILTLARVHGMTAREIASELDISTRAVEKSLALGVARLAFAVKSTDAGSEPDRFGDGRQRLSQVCNESPKSCP
jgi:RNA polymerase sigma factor (sigma-70 family)